MMHSKKTKVSRLLSIVALTIILPLTASAADEWTGWREVTVIRTNVDSGGLLIKGNSGWGASGCSSATWVYLKQSNYQDLLKVDALVSQVKNQKVRYFGSCRAGSPSVFDARYSELM